LVHCYAVALARTTRHSEHKGTSKTHYKWDDTVGGLGFYIPILGESGRPGMGFPP